MLKSCFGDIQDKNTGVVTYSHSFNHIIITIFKTVFTFCCFAMNIIIRVCLSMKKNSKFLVSEVLFTFQVYFNMLYKYYRPSIQLTSGIRNAAKTFYSSDVLKVLKNLKIHVYTMVNFVNKKNTVFSTFWTFS